MPPVEKKIPKEQFEPLPRCQAYSQQSGYQCRKNAVKGKKVCRYHGGLSLSGANSPSYKHGKYSKYLPADLLKKVGEAANDPDLLSMRDEIHILEGRLMILFERVESGGGTANWRDLNGAWRRYIRAQREENPEDIADSARAINEIVQRGLHDTMVWIDIQTTMENLRRLKDAQSKRMAEMHQTITYEKAMALLLAIAEILKIRLRSYQVEKKPVDDGLLKSISGDLMQLITIPENES